MVDKQRQTEYVIGLDFGTLSLRGVLVNRETGLIEKDYEIPYPHGTMDRFLLEEENKLPPDYALQVASDYRDTLDEVIVKLVSEVASPEKAIKAIGMDFTACTVLPLDENGTPLSEDPAFADNPHAYVKLWKHHGAQEQAERITELGKALSQPWLAHYGGVISPEWLIPKTLEILDKAPEVFDQADLIMEAGDYMTYYLTGVLSRSACHAGYKGMWSEERGFVEEDFLIKLHPRFKRLYAEKLRGRVQYIGHPLGYLKGTLANKWGLSERVVITPSVIDAHATTPSVGISKSGDMLMIIGTSSCDILIHHRFACIDGINGVVKNGVLPGFTAYESGQAAVGDIFSWFMDNHVPYSYYLEAKQQGKDIYQYMLEKIQTIPAGKKPLLALDWWNGSRSIIMDSGLSGVIMGYTLTTSPEEVYRGLIEATAFGKKKIIDAYQKAHVPVHRLFAAGGLAVKNPYLMQVYADVLQKEILVRDTKHASAKGAAVYASMAYERERIRGGHADESIIAGVDFGNLTEQQREAEIDKYLLHIIEEMAQEELIIYRPNPEKQKYYADLYALYEEAYEYFGIGKDSILKKLKQ